VSARVDNDVVPEGGAGAAAARGGLQRAGGFLAGQLLTVGAVALLFRHLGVDDTGQLVTVLSLVAIVQGFTDLGLTTLGVRELSRTPPEGRRALMADLLGLRLAATTVGGALVVAFAAAVGFGGVVVAGTALASVALVIQNTGTTLGMDLLVRLRAGRTAVGDLVRQATMAVLTLIGVAFGAGLLVFVAAMIPAALAGFVVVVAAAMRVGPAREPRRWGTLMRQTIPFAVAAAASVLFFRVAVVEMSLLAGDHEAGLFGASFRVVEVLSAIPPLAVSAIFPVLSTRAAAESPSLVAAVRRTSQACAAAGGALALGLALGAPAVIEVIAGSAFDDAIPVLRIQGVALAASFVAAPWGFALLSLGRERTLMWLNVVGVTIALAVGAALIEADGARGGALTTVLGEAGLAIGFAIALTRARPELRPDLPGLAKVVVAAAIGALAYLLPVPAIPMAAVGLLVYGAVLAALRGLPNPRGLLGG
jgi:O-antigen/teichoic acid export membrane protein